MKRTMILAAMLAPLVLGGCGIKTVDQGNTGVKKTLGKVDSDPLPAGFYTYNPFMSSIIEMDNKTQKYESNSEVYTKDVQQVSVTYVLNYNLLPSETVKLYATVGENYADLLIPQTINGILKNTIGKWEAIELVANRGKASADIEAAIGAELRKSGLNVSGLQLTNIKFGKEFEDAVEAKVTAVQKAEQAKNQTVQVQEQANQRVIAAKADAQAMQIKSEALSKNQGLVAYEAVQKWDGVLPQYIVGGNISSFLPVPSTKGE